MPVRARRPRVMYSAFAGMVSLIDCTAAPVAPPCSPVPSVAALIVKLFSRRSACVNLGDSAESSASRGTTLAGRLPTRSGFRTTGVLWNARTQLHATSLPGRGPIVERDGDVPPRLPVHDRE